MTLFFLNRFYIDCNKKMDSTTVHLKYIVSFKEDTSEEDYRKAKHEVIRAGGAVLQEHSKLMSFAAEIPEDHLDTLTKNPQVSSCEQD